MVAYHRCQSVKTAEANSSRLLKNAEVFEGYERDRRLGYQEKARLAFFDPRKLFHVTGELKKIHAREYTTATGANKTWQD